MTVLLECRSPISVAVVCPPSTQSYTRIYAWLDEMGVPAAIIAIHASIDEFLAKYGVGTNSQVDLVIVRREDDGHFDESALRRMCSSGHRVVVFGTSVHDDAIAACLDAGAWAFIAGDRRHLGYLAVTLRSAADFAQHLGDRTPAGIPLPGLTRRESEVLVAWCHAATKDDVAGRLAIERATVSSHLQRIRAKYAAVGRAATTKGALIARAVQDGLVDINEL